MAGPTIAGITMGAGTKPADESVRDLLATGAIRELPAYAKLLQGALEQQRAIDAEPLIPQAKAERKAKVREAALANAAKLLAVTAETAGREFDQAEGSARAAGRREDLVRQPTFQSSDDAALEARQFRREQTLNGAWMLRMSTIATETDAEALEALADDAMLCGAPDVQRAVLTALLHRARVLAEQERTELPNQEGARPVQLAHGRLLETFTQFRKAHPTPGERVRTIADARKRLQNDLERSARVYRRLYGFGDQFGSR